MDTRRRFCSCPHFLPVFGRRRRGPAGIIFSPPNCPWPAAAGAPAGTPFSRRPLFAACGGRLAAAVPARRDYFLPAPIARGLRQRAPLPGHHCPVVHCLRPAAADLRRWCPPRRDYFLPAQIARALRRRAPPSRAPPHVRAVSPCVPRAFLCRGHPAADTGPYTPRRALLSARARQCIFCSTLPAVRRAPHTSRHTPAPLNCLPYPAADSRRAPRFLCSLLHGAFAAARFCRPMPWQTAPPVLQ